MAVFLYNWTFWEYLTVMLLPLLSSDNVIRSQCKCCWQLFYLVSLVLKDSFTCNQIWIFGMASLVCKEVNPDFPLELQLHPLRWYSEESICILSIINQLLSSLLAFPLRKSHCLHRTGSQFPSSFFPGQDGGLYQSRTNNEGLVKSYCRWFKTLSQMIASSVLSPSFFHWSNRSKHERTHTAVRKCLIK